MTWIIRILSALEISLCILFFAILLAGSSALVPTSPADAVRRYTRPVEFDFVNWTLDTLGIKLGQGATRHSFLL